MLCSSARNQIASLLKTNPEKRIKIANVIHPCVPSVARPQEAAAPIALLPVLANTQFLHRSAFKFPLGPNI